MEILKKRFSELELKEPRWLQDCFAQLFKELRAKNISWKPHYWWSEEWFAPDGVGGFAIPFYLGHKDLIALHRKMLLTAEGSTPAACLKILRHETGHAIANAFCLEKHPAILKAFGSFRAPYPTAYRPEIYRSDFVSNLGWGYGQSHPTEDFAETFSVWLRCPVKVWEKRYATAPALNKLRVMNDVLQGSVMYRRAERPFPKKVEPIQKNHQTLRTYYRKKRTSLGYDRRERQLHKVFALHRNAKTDPKAWFARHQNSLVANLSKAANIPKYCALWHVLELQKQIRSLGRKIPANCHSSVNKWLCQSKDTRRFQITM